MPKRSLPDRFVNDCLSFPVRVALSTLVASLCVAGLLAYPSFSKLLDVGVAPPTGSPSGEAKAAYHRYFATNPIQIIAHVRTRDGSPLTTDDLARCSAAAANRELEAGGGCPTSEALAARYAAAAGVLEGDELADEDEPSPPPSALPLDAAVQNVSNALKAIVESYTDASASTAGQCDSTSFTSYWSLPDFAHMDFNGSAPNVTAPPDVLRRLLAPQLFANGHSETVMAVTVSSCLVEEHGQVVSRNVAPGCVTAKKEECMPIHELSESWKRWVVSPGAVDPRLEVAIVSLPDVFAAALDGVDQTMRVSTATAPLAFAILGCTLRNARLLLLPLVNILACLFGTTLVMLVVAQRSEVSSQAPALMLACALAMTIDYSLFLLTRFSDELHRRKTPYRRAVVVMLETSGHTVLVSGLTLTLCFFGMLLIPVSTIASLGVASAVTVLFAISMALVYTPTLLLSFPAFFADASRFGCSSSGCLCGWWCTLCSAAASARPKALGEAFLARGAASSTSGAAIGSAAVSPPTSGPLPLERQSADPERTTDMLESPTPHASLHVDELLAIAARRSRRGCWPAAGMAVQRPWVAPLVIVVLGALAVPFARPLASPDLTYVEGVQPLLPRGATTTDAFLALQASFGVSGVFPNQILIVPDRPDDLLTREWLDAACAFVERVSANVSAAMDAQGHDCFAPAGRPCMAPSDFEGMMILGGNCTAALYDAIPTGEVSFNVSGFPNGTVTFNVTDAALEEVVEFLLTYVAHNPDHAATKVKLTTTIDPFGIAGRAWIQAVRDALAANEYVDGVHLGTLYFTGLPQEQMDGSQYTFDALPLVIGATLCIVCVVLLVAFRSVLVPLRAAVCIVWMLIVTFGSSVLVYQEGALSGTGLGFLSPGAISPSISHRSPPPSPTDLPPIAHGSPSISHRPSIAH